MEAMKVATYRYKYVDEEGDDNDSRYSRNSNGTAMKTEVSPKKIIHQSNLSCSLHSWKHHKLSTTARMVDTLNNKPHY